MKTARFLFPLLWIVLFFVGCKDEESAYPSIITKFADVRTDANGTMCQFRTDDGKVYTISNPLTGYHPNVVYRTVCGYLPEGTTATVYQLQSAYFLCDSTSVRAADPISVTSVWKEGKYINMQLAPLSQGGRHYWGFAVDSIAEHHAYLHLHHNQLSDPTSYTAETYASLPVDSIPSIQAGDSITLSITTFKGESTWNFKN